MVNFLGWLNQVGSLILGTFLKIFIAYLNNLLNMSLKNVTIKYV